MVVFVSPSCGMITRQMGGITPITSEYQAGSRSEPNPQYAVAAALVQQAQIDYASTRAQANQVTSQCTGWGCVLAATVAGQAINEAEAKVRAAIATLSQTPPTIERPTYSPYEFRSATIQVEKMASATVVIVDRNKHAWGAGLVEVRDSKTFNVAYGLSDKDRTHSSPAASMSTEDTVDRFAKQPLPLPLSKLHNKAMAIDLHASPASIDQITLALAQSPVSQPPQRRRPRALPISRTGADSRLLSVVVVNNPNGSLGSGFFVANSLIVTNAHVIEGSHFTHIQTYDNHEATGQVVAEDARLDLALIRVDGLIGNAVHFYSGEDLPLGATVNVIGHPENMAFSITRGIISAIRDLPSLYAPSGDAVRFIQTDAATNPGNSGGPVFLGDRVVGVSDWKVVKDAAQGIAFAIDYREVLGFLDRHGVVGARRLPQNR